MNKKRFLDLFKRYKADEASEEETSELMRMVESGRYDEWIKNRIHQDLASDDQHIFKDHLDMAEEKADELRRDILNVEPERTAARITMRPAYSQYSRSSAPTNWKWVAAALVLFIGLSSLYVNQITGGAESEATEKIAAQVVMTNRGERTSLILGDGSRVTLNADSRLQIPVDFGRQSRTLFLEGEAFFEVEHDSKHAFRVYTEGDIYTEVLGTRFNVKNYGNAGDRGKVNVTVAEGRVRLGSENENQPNSVEVAAGQKGAIGHAGVISVVDIPEIEMDAYLGWVEGRMVFNDQPLGEIIKVLERWFDIDVTTTDPDLLQRRMSATFHGDPLSEILQVISHALQIEFTQDRREVQFFL